MTQTLPTLTLAAACDLLAAYLAADIPAFLWGQPGIGKSDAVATVASDIGFPLIDLRAVMLDPVDLRGLPHIVDDKAVFADPSILPNAERDGPHGILFLDELNAAPPSVQAACFQLVLNRRCGDYRLPPGWRIVAAGNRQADKAAAQRMPTALANRFAHIEVSADVPAWCAWAIKRGLDPIMPAFIRFRPELLHKMEGSDLRAFPTPRAWASVAKLLHLPEAARMNAFSGLVGMGAAAELFGFMRIYQSLPPVADIIANPDGAPVPNDPATQYAICGALARKAGRGNLERVFRYGARLPREFGILLAVDAVKRDPALTETAAFVAWAQANQDVTV